MTDKPSPSAAQAAVPAGAAVAPSAVAVAVAAAAAGSVPEAFPATIEAISPEWLTDALRAAGALGTGRVTAIEVRPVSEPGQASTATRLLLTLEDAPAGAPRSVVAKVAATYGAVRRSAMALGLYEREVRFYQELGADAGIPVPHCYFAAIEPASGNFLLLLEDLSHCRVGDFWVSSLADVTVAIDALAPFHARWWNSTALREAPWLRQPDDPVYQQMLGGVARGCVPVMQQRWPARCGGYLGRVSTRLAERWEAYAAMEPGAPWTLVHTDFHPKQMFFPGDSGGRFAVFDWQAVAVARAEADLSRILLTGLREADLAQHQDALVERYHAALSDAGVPYPIEVLQRQTRKAMLNSLFIIVYALTTTDVRILEGAAAARGVDLEERIFVDLEQSLERNRVLDLIP